jgi:hypothetical protein
MPRQWPLLIGLTAAAILNSGGCRSCSNCHDYDPPVADCECNACGCHRAGSASGGYEEAGYATEEYATEPPANEPILLDSGDSDMLRAGESEPPTDAP